MRGMSTGNIGRITLAIVVGYVADAILIVATEYLFSRLVPGVEAAPPLYYLVIDLITQCVYTVIGGYLCCIVAQPSRRAAMAGLMALGVLVGTASVVTSWKTEPHWYGIALLVVYPPCVWMGWKLRARANGPNQSKLGWNSLMGE
jgi:hypothetical protein